MDTAAVHYFASDRPTWLAVLAAAEREGITTAEWVGRVVAERLAADAAGDEGDRLPRG